MPEAARIHDPIGHSPTMNWLISGLLIGAAVGLAAILIVGTGGLAAVAVVAGMACMGAGIGEALSTMSWAGKEVSGQIDHFCSPNVFVNSRFSARAHVDVVICDKHSGTPPIAEGSASVWINSMPAARQGDRTGCSAVIMTGSLNVFIGGGTKQTDTINPENLVPGWVHTLLFVVGIASALVLAGPFAVLFGLLGSIAFGSAFNYLGGKWFGEGSDGQKWMALGGSILGGIVCGSGGAKLDSKYVITAEGLGANGGNLRIQPRTPAEPPTLRNPTTGRFESNPNRPPSDLQRPYIRAEVRQSVESSAMRTPDGKPIDPNTLKPIDGSPDLGHKPGNEFWSERDAAQTEGLTQQQFNDRMNDPSKYQLEDPSSNRSHRYEQK